MGAEFCPQHARDSVVTTVNQGLGKEGCSKLDAVEKHSIDEAQPCRPSATSHNAYIVSDTGEPTSEMSSSCHDPKKGRGGNVAHVQDKKRKHAARPASIASECVGARWSVCPGPRQTGTTPQLLSGQMSTGAEGKVSPAARIRSGPKVELTVPSDARGVGEVEEYSGQAVPSRSWSSADGSGSPSISSRVVSAEPLCNWLAAIPVCIGVYDDVKGEEAKKTSNVKSEPGSSSPPP